VERRRQPSLQNGQEIGRVSGEASWVVVAVPTRRDRKQQQNSY